MKISQSTKNGLMYAAMIILAIIAIYSTYKSIRQSKISETYRKEIIKKDSLVSDQQGLFTKKLGDTISNYRKLLNLVKLENQDLYRKLKDADKKPIIVGTITQKPKDQSSVITEDTSDREVVTGFYPNEQNWIIKYYNRVIDENTVAQNWNFTYTPITIAISETKTPGVFDIDYQGPDYVDIGEITFSSLPMSPVREDKSIHYLFGAGAGRDYINDTPFIQGVIGVDINNNQFQFQVGTLGTISGYYIKRF